MNSIRTLLLRILFPAALTVALAAAAHAASISASQHEGYTRLTFGFDNPASLSISGGGKDVILTFDPPLKDSATTLQPQLERIVNGIQQSADGKRVVLNLKQNYRVRQFTSGNNVGVDVVESVTPAAAEQPPKPPTAVAPTPPPAAETSTAPPPAEPVSAPQIIATKPAEAKPVAAISPPAEKKPLPVETTPASEPAKVIRVAPSPILTTKNSPAPAPLPEPDLSIAPNAALGPEDTEETVAPPAPAPAVMSTKQPAVPATAAEETQPPSTAPSAAPAQEPSPEPAPEATAAPAATTEKPAKTDGPFLVGVRPSKAGTELIFPWQERVAAAAFERGNAIWLVFSKPQVIDTAMLKTVLPKAIIKLEQFAYKDATVLRLIADGNLHPNLSQPDKSYEWTVTLSNALPVAALDVPVSGDRDKDGKTFLRLEAFDIAQPLKFYDPTVGDLLVVAPAYEVGRGVANQKTTPELTVLQTQQGIAVSSLRDHLSTELDRTGIKLRAKGSLAVSQNLPVLSSNAAPVPGVSATASVALPYDQWYVAPEEFYNTLAIRLGEYVEGSDEHKPQALLKLAQMYLAHGLGSEARGYLQRLEAEAPEFYRANNAALLEAVTQWLDNRPQEATTSIARPELDALAETALWRQALGLLAPPLMNFESSEPAPPAATSQAPVDPAAPPPAPANAAPPALKFDYMGFNKSYIRYYPPRIRQRLAILAADNYVKTGQPEKAVAVYDTLNRDGILAPVQPYAELMLGSIGAGNGNTKDALVVWDRLSIQQDDLFIQARARYEAAMLRYALGQRNGVETAALLENLHTSWRGDGLERQILVTIAGIYREEKRYDETLRALKTLLQAFPGDPDTLSIAGDMSDLFQELFLNGLADEMSPLKSLALFYEFRELTPIGETGDRMIQKLADRLASVDLLDRATLLLEHQIRFRLSGEERARVGARLALLYLFSEKPQRALEVMEITNYGDMPVELRRQRMQITAQALAANGRPEDGLNLLAADASMDGALERLDILWNMQDWPNVINAAEDILAARPNLTDPLTARETPVLLKLALAYSFENDTTQLSYLRDYYMALMTEGPYRDIFDYITNDTTPLDAEDFAMVAGQISRTESFLDLFKKKIADGKLSEVAASNETLTDTAGETPPAAEAPAQAPAAEATPAADGEAAPATDEEAAPQTTGDLPAEKEPDSAEEKPPTEKSTEDNAAGKEPPTEG